jgi:hypothetical protein
LPYVGSHGFQAIFVDQTFFETRRPRGLQLSGNQHPNFLETLKFKYFARGPNLKVLQISDLRRIRGLLVRAVAVDRLDPPWA